MTDLNSAAIENVDEVACFISPPCTLRGLISEINAVVGLGAHFKARHYYDKLYPELGVEFPTKLVRAIHKRRAEFLAGRYLAQDAIWRLFGRISNVGIGEQRQPIWPCGLSGSISHTKGYAVCLVVKDPDCLVAIDVEQVLSSEACATVSRMCMHSNELVRLECGNENFATMLTLLFSAKETLFKALFPRVGIFFNFDAANLLAVDLKSGCLMLELTRNLGGRYRSGRIFSIRFLLDAQRVLTYCIEID